MPEIILHQYVTSPFSEKIRKIFAHKKISWRSVEQPVIMPKPKLVPLTGGYRRIPVLQIGADVWCDTGIIIRKIDELKPEPTIYPGGLTAAADTMNQWADRRLFWSTTPVIFEKLARGGAQGIYRGPFEDDAGCELRRHCAQRRPIRETSCARSWRFSIANSHRRRSCLAIRSASPTPPASIRCGSCAPSRLHLASRRNFRISCDGSSVSTRWVMATCARWIPTRR